MFALLDFLSSVMPIICVLCVIVFIALLVSLVALNKKSKDTKKIKTAIIICFVCTILMVIGTIVVLDAYGKAAYEQSEDYQMMQDSIEKSEEIIERNQGTLEELDRINEALE